MTLPDDTPTSELPVISGPVTPEPAIAERGRRRRLDPIVRFLSGRRVAATALAIVVTVGIAGIALGATGGGHDYPPIGASRFAGLPTQVAPTRTAPSRASRANRRATAASPSSPPRPSSQPNATGKPAPKSPSWVAPMKGFHLNSCFGMRWGRIHQGIDFAVAYGAPIYAAHAGVVVSAGFNGDGYGNMVLIKHGPHLFTLYGHASRLLVHAGQEVTAGQKIALEGASGHVTGPHMHFEVWTAMWQRINPGPFLAKHGIHLNRCQ